MIISVINHKGGVGKTTSCVSMAAGLVRLGKKVLAVDMDAQANLTTAFGLPTISDNNINDALLDSGIKVAVHQTQSGVDLICSTLDLAMAEMRLQSEPGREYLLKDILEPFSRVYDYIFIDCPPAVGLLTMNALSCSDRTIIPIEPSKFAVAGMTNLFDVIEKIRQRLNKKLKGWKLLITRLDARKTIHKDVVNVIRTNYKDKVFQTAIRSNVALEEAQMRGVDIFSYSGSSAGAEDYLAVCREILQEK